MGGLFVRTDHLEEVGTEIFVDLLKSGWKRQLTLNARITSRVDSVAGPVSKRMPGMGIQFLRLDDKQHARLQSLLRELGAPEEDLQITLSEEHAEEEIRGLDLDIEGALREVDLPPPGPVEFEEPPPPPSRAREAARAPELVRAPAPDTSTESRLMLQIRGLVLQLSESQQQLDQRDLEIERLKNELDTIRGALTRKQ